MTTPSGTEASTWPDAGPGSQRRRRAFLFTSALVALVVLILAREVLLPFLLAVVLAYVLSPVVRAGERLSLFGRQPRRWVVVLCLYVGLLGSIITLVSVSAPRLADEIGRLARDAPRIAEDLKINVIPEVERRLRETSALYFASIDKATGDDKHATESVAPPHPGPSLDPSAIQVRPRGDGGFEIAVPPQGLRVVPEGEHGYRIMPIPVHTRTGNELHGAILNALSDGMDSVKRSTTSLSLIWTARNVLAWISRSVFVFAMTLMLSAYMLITSQRIFEFFRLFYRIDRRPDFDDLVLRLDRGLAGVVRGQLIICMVNGVLSGIGFWLLGVPYWTFLTALAAVMSLIPIFGSILSTVPAVTVSLLHGNGLGLALLVLGWVVAIHQLEANVLNPKIMGDSARVHPVLVVFALLTGEHLFGIVGALLAVPVLSISQTLFLHLRERFLGVPRNSSVPPAPDQPAHRPSQARPAAAPSAASADLPISVGQPQK